MIKWKEWILAITFSALILAFVVLVSAGVLMLVVNWFCELFAIGFLLSFAQSCGVVLLIWVLKSLFSSNTVKVKID